MKLIQINDIKIKPIKASADNELESKGSAFFENAYSNIYLCAKKKSGKSTCLYNIVRSCINKYTKVYIFCSTVHKDPIYKYLISKFKRKGVEYETFTELDEDILREIISEIKNNVEEDEDSAEDQPLIRQETAADILRSKMFERIEEAEQREYKPKYLSPEYLFIFDDMGNSLKCRSIDQLLKTNRHFKSRVIISSQYLNDLSIASRMQLDYILLFKGMSFEKLEETYKNLDISISLPEFMEMYTIATNEPYSFFYIDIRNDRFRKNFDTEITCAV